MAFLSSSPTSPGRGAGPTFRVSTREISLDLATVGPSETPNELGALSAGAFCELIQRFASIPAVKLLDGDPQLVVSAKRGRYVIVPSGGQLLVRPANDSQQPFVKFSVADLPGYLDSNDQPAATPTDPKNFQTLIGSAAAVVPTIPPGAPIYGNIPVSRSAAPTADSDASVPSSSHERPKIRRGLVSFAATFFALGLAGAGWVFYGPAPAATPSPARTLAEFDPVTSADLLASLSKRFVGTYATSGEAGERLLEIRADGMFHYQEFGAGISTTANRRGTYTFALRHANKAPLIRASNLGTIEIRDERNLFCQGVTFTKVP